MHATAFGAMNATTEIHANGNCASRMTATPTPRNHPVDLQRDLNLFKWYSRIG
jgi:hypothetical protein